MESQRTMHNRRLEAEVLARQGLRLPPITLRCLRTAGIYCQPSVSIEHQHLAKKYVLRGVESGGAVAEIGAYASYVDEQGNALPWLQRVDSIGVNGVHAIVVAPVLIRVQMLRIERTYDLLITRHSTGKVREGPRPSLKVPSFFMAEGAAWRWSRGGKMLRSAAPSVRFSIHGRGNVWCCQTTSKMLPTESRLPCAASAAVIVICSDPSQLPLTGRRIAALLM